MRTSFTFCTSDQISCFRGKTEDYHEKNIYLVIKAKENELDSQHGSYIELQGLTEEDTPSIRQVVKEMQRNDNIRV